jgi:hypothetical protein
MCEKNELSCVENAFCALSARSFAGACSDYTNAHTHTNTRTQIQTQIHTHTHTHTRAHTHTSKHPHPHTGKSTTYTHTHTHTHTHTRHTYSYHDAHTPQERNRPSVTGRRGGAGLAETLKKSEILKKSLA